MSPQLHLRKENFLKIENKTQEIIGMSSDLANLENAELKEAFDAFDKVNLNWVNLASCHGEC